MNSDIDNWVEFLNETVEKANIDDVAFDKKNVSIDLKMSAIPLLKQFIGDIKGRQLTSVLQNLEKSFILVSKHLKLEKNVDDFRKLSFLALSKTVVEILREMRVDAYSKGKRFDPITFLDNYEINIKNKTNNKNLKKNKNLNKNSKKNKPKDESSDDEELEEDSDDEDSDSDYDPKYMDEESVDEEDSEDYEENTEEDSSEDSEEYEDSPSSKRKRKLSVRGRKQKRPKLDLDFLNSLNTTLSPKSYEDQAFSHFTKFEDDKKRAFLDKFKSVVESENNTEPILFKIVNMDLPVEQKNSILTEYMNVENSLSDKSKLKSWLDNVMKIPFGKEKGLNLDSLKKSDEVGNFIKDLSKKMDEAVWGHTEAKKKVIEIMVQYITNPDSKGNCLGIWGPPGNGKTTLIKEGIAKAMDRSFVFISLGGASDASFLEGHSYTYEGSIYGRIAQGLMKSDCMNPIIYFDELDKISNTPKGQEITNLLVHLTDPVQNSEFIDKYFYNIKLDLSKVTFIFSYNDPSLVDPVLRDRITQVETKYLLSNQKVFIAQRYLIPAILKDIGIDNDSFQISDNLISKIISKYTLEGGVRKLKSIFYSMIRQLNILALTKDKLSNKVVNWPFKVENDDLDILLKEYNKVSFQKINSDSKVGVINGMWAGSLGIGGVLQIESSWIPAQNRNFIKATGSLEKVIKESIEVANTLAWSFVDKKVKKKLEDEFKEVPFGIHVHCPEGAIPKDGPSAGTALTVLFYSLYTKKKIKNDIAITGEINLQGQVLQIGGLEEKLQGSKKAGVKTAIIPNENLKDIPKIKERNPTLIDKNFKVIDVQNINQVLKHVFE